MSTPTNKGTNAGFELASLVCGVPGAGSIDHRAVLRNGGVRKLFAACCALSRLRPFLRQSAPGHVHQIEEVASQFPCNVRGTASWMSPRSASSCILRHLRMFGRARFALSATSRFGTRRLLTSAREARLLRATP